MNTKEYKRLLGTDRWKNFANDVKRRDGYKCVKCGGTQTLQAHHKIYYKNCLPWEYSIDFLETLCSKCHLAEHKNKNINDFNVDTATFKKMRIENRIKHALVRVNVRGKTASQIYEEMFGKPTEEVTDAPF
jgi:5-methylcytosine-specific restriction endonuclease McrA